MKEVGRRKERKRRRREIGAGARSDAATTATTSARTTTPCPDRAQHPATLPAPFVAAGEEDGAPDTVVPRRAATTSATTEGTDLQPSLHRRRARPAACRPRRPLLPRRTAPPCHDYSIGALSTQLLRHDNSRTTALHPRPCRVGTVRRRKPEPCDYTTKPHCFKIVLVLAKPRVEQGATRRSLPAPRRRFRCTTTWAR